MVWLLQLFLSPQDTCMSVYTVVANNNAHGSYSFDDEQLQ